MIDKTVPSTVLHFTLIIYHGIPEVIFQEQLEIGTCYWQKLLILIFLGLDYNHCCNCIWLTTWAHQQGWLLSKLIIIITACRLDNWKCAREPHSQDLEPFLHSINTRYLYSNDFSWMKGVYSYCTIPLGACKKARSITAWSQIFTIL